MSLFSNIEREVVAKRVAIVAAVTGALHVVVALHWLTVAQSDETIKAVTGAIDLLGAGAGALFVRAGVTPNSDPRSASGTPLVEVKSIESRLEPVVRDVLAVVDPVIAEPRNPNSTV